jgi:hypothetical protein
MSKQTAVQLLKESIDHELKLGTKMVVNWDMYLAMEKEQIRDSYIAGFNQRDEVDKGLFFNPLAVTYCEKVFSQYYNETYGGDK